MGQGPRNKVLAWREEIRSTEPSLGDGLQIVRAGIMLFSRMHSLLGTGEGPLVIHRCKRASRESTQSTVS
jgi:hypothetical protein